MIFLNKNSLDKKINFNDKGKLTLVIVGRLNIADLANFNTAKIESANAVYYLHENLKLIRLTDNYYQLELITVLPVEKYVRISTPTAFNTIINVSGNIKLKND